jgi:hypothetical protein
MKRSSDQKRSIPTESADPVWDLLAQSPPPKAGPMFARNVVRAVRIEAKSTPPGWWARSRAAIMRRPAIHLAPLAAAAALAVFFAWPNGGVSHDSGSVVARIPAANETSASQAESADAFFELEDVAAGELLAAADLSKFSDDELLSLLDL